MTRQIFGYTFALERRTAGIGIVVILAIVLGAVLPLFLSTFQTSLALKVLIWAVVATGFNFAFGFTNILSLGHATFFAIGAYGIAIILEHSEFIPLVTDGLVLPTFLTLVLVGIAAVLMGYIALRSTGIYFALITFAFAEIIHKLIQKADITGGTNGLILRPVELPIGVGLSIQSVYYLAYLVLLFTVVSHYIILNSSFGRIMRAVRSNEQRAEALGYPVKQIKLVVFVISALYTGAGGILYILFNQFISPSSASLGILIDILVITIIGGAPFLLGPLVGSVFFVSLNTFTRDFEQIGLVMTGAVFIIFIILMPRGIVGKARELYLRAMEKFGTLFRRLNFFGKGAER